MSIFVKERLRSACPATTNTNLRALKSLGNFLVEMEMLPEKNAFSKIKMLKVDEKPVRFMTIEQFNSIVEAEPRKHLKAIYRLGAMTGLRCNQLLSLKWESISFDRKIVQLTSEHSKNRRISTLPLSEPAHQLLQQLYQPTNVYVFQKPNACVPTSYSRIYVSHQFKQAARKAKVDNVHFHTLRKSFGSWCIASGVSMWHTSKLLNHASISTTEKFYAGFNIDDLTVAINKIPLTQL